MRLDMMINGQTTAGATYTLLGLARQAEKLVKRQLFQQLAMRCCARMLGRGFVKFTAGLSFIC
jgi:hypothetical protein